MKTNINNVYVDEDAYNIATDILKDVKYYNKDNNNLNTSKESLIEVNKELNKLNKWDELAKEIQFEEIITNPFTKQVLNSENKNDIRKIRVNFEKPSVSKFEICTIYKQFGDFCLNNKEFEMAKNIYDIALSFLFITKFNDDEEETNKQKNLRSLLYSNLAFANIQLKDYYKALDFLKENLIYDSKNIKTIYRVAFCYQMLKDVDKAFIYCKAGLDIDSNNIEFKNMKEDLTQIINKRDLKQKQLFKKLINK